MKYFIDTEFIEDFTRPWIGKARHYIDLISIAIVAEDGREYYAVSNEFDIRYAWNKFQWKGSNSPIVGNATIHKKKEYWLRWNVLQPIHSDLAQKESNDDFFHNDTDWFSLTALKILINKYGKSNKQIAQDITRFVMPGRDDVAVRGMDFSEYKKVFGKPEFYGYYADYDWVLFCSLYGRMLDLPKGFPMYCMDLKQMMEEKNAVLKSKRICHPMDFHSATFDDPQNPQDCYARYQDHHNYPKQSNAHNALDDARWNKKLYDFLQTV